MTATNAVRRGAALLLPKTLPASPDDLETEINRRGAIIARLRADDPIDHVEVDRLCADVDELTRAFIRAWHNEHDD